MCWTWQRKKYQIQKLLLMAKKCMMLRRKIRSRFLNIHLMVYSSELVKEESDNLKNLVSESILKFALDATAFYQGFHLRSNDTCITTRLVFEEISHIQEKFSILESLISSNKIMILEPNELTVKMIKAVITQIGETRLSDADISIVALAKEFNATLVSDDFSICNLA